MENLTVQYFFISSSFFNYHDYHFKNVQDFNIIKKTLFFLMLRQVHFMDDLIDVNQKTWKIWIQLYLKESQMQQINFLGKFLKIKQITKYNFNDI